MKQEERQQRDNRLFFYGAVTGFMLAVILWVILSLLGDSLTRT